MNKEIEIMDIKSKMLKIPILIPPEKPCSIVEPNISVILAGPETAFFTSTPLNKTPILFIVTPMFLKESTTPLAKAWKILYFGVDYKKQIIQSERRIKAKATIQ